MPSQLQRLVQSDWGAGIQSDLARHLISPSGAYDIVNGLLDDDGSVYRRGGATVQVEVGGELGESSPGEGEGDTTIPWGGGRWIWEGRLAGGRRIVVGGTSFMGAVDDDTLIYFTAPGMGRALPPSVVEVEGMLFIAAPSVAPAGSMAGR